MDQSPCVADSRSFGQRSSHPYGIRKLLSKTNSTAPTPPNPPPPPTDSGFNKPYLSMIFQGPNLMLFFRFLLENNVYKCEALCASGKTQVFYAKPQGE